MNGVVLVMGKYTLTVIASWFIGSILLFYWPLAFGFVGVLGLIWIGLTNLRLLMLLIGILLVAQPLLVFSRIPFLNNFDELLMFIALACVFLKKLINGKFMVRTPIDLWFLMLLTIGIMSSVIHHIVPTSIMLGGLLLFCKGFLFFYIFSNIPIKTQDLDVLMKTFLILGVIVAAYGIFGAAVPRLFLAPLGIVNQSTYIGIPALQSFLGHPGAFSAFMAVLAAFTFSQYWITGRKKPLILNVFFVVCMILSFRRTSVAGYFLAVLVVIFGRGFPKPAISVNRKFILAGLISLVISFLGVLAPMYSKLYQGYFLSGDTPRSMLLKIGVRIATDFFPLGAGFGTFASGINRTFYSPLFYKYQLFTTWGLSEDKASFTNDAFWPHVLAETGILGFILYLGIIYLLFRVIIKALRLSIDLCWKAVALGTFMMFIVGVLESTKGSFYEATLWAYLYFGGVGLLFSKTMDKKQSVFQPIVSEME